MPDQTAVPTTPHAGRKLLVGVVALLLLATGCYFAATQVMDDLYAHTSPLNTVEVPLGDPVAPEPSEGRFVFVLVDGLRADTASDAELMPTLAKLREQGSWRVLHSRAPSYSAPGWTVLGTGGWPYLNGGEVMNPEGTDPLLWQQDNIFAAAKDAGLRVGVSGNHWWRSMLSAETWVKSLFMVEEDTAADELLVDEAVEWLNDDLVDLLLLDVTGVDDAGHNKGGPDGDAWPVAARAADAQIARIVDSLDLSRDSILIVSDHGHIGPGGHGGTEPEVMTEPLIVAGPSVTPGTYPDAEQIDVAPTVATILGTRLPAVAQGRPLVDMLNTVPSGLDEALRTQQEELARAHARALGRPDTYSAPADDPVSATQAEMDAATNAILLPGRLWRGAAALVVLAAAGVALWRSRGRKLSMRLLGAAAFLIAFHAWYALVLGKTYSLSWVLDSGNLIITVATAALIALVVALPIPLLTTRPWRNGPKEAAHGTVAAAVVIALVALVPSLVSWVLNGISSPYAVPEMHTMWFGFIGMLQALVVAAVGLLAAALAAGATRLFRRTAV